MSKNSEPFIVQKFLPEIKKGDKRIILIDGEPVAAVRRVPKKNEIRSNIHVGGKVESIKLNKRDLPWRKTNNPYKIWISEIILQQTRVLQGLPYYIRFIEKFPDVKSLAKADEEEVLKMWQGLGYYSRARNLHFTAKYISNELQGIFPNSFNELIQLKGIGEYTASAIASFAFNERKAVLDGNVFRLLSRYFGLKDPIPKYLFAMFLTNNLISEKYPTRSRAAYPPPR